MNFHDSYSIDTQGANQPLNQLTAKAAEAEKAVESTARAVRGTDQALATLDRRQQGFRWNTSTWLSMAYIIDDAQYGLMGVANNLQMLAIQMGVGGPWVAAITIGLTTATMMSKKMGEGIRELQKDWMGYVDVTNTGLSTNAKALENVKKQAEALAKQKIGSVDDQLRYNSLLETQAGLEKKITEEKQAQATLDALLKGQGPDAIVRAQAFAAEFSGENADIGADLARRTQAHFAEITNARQAQEMDVALDPLQRLLRGAQAAGASPGYQKSILDRIAAQRALLEGRHAGEDEAAKAQAGGLLQRAQSGDQAAAAELAELFGDDRGALGFGVRAVARAPRDARVQAQIDQDESIRQQHLAEIARNQAERDRATEEGERDAQQWRQKLREQNERDADDDRKKRIQAGVAAAQPAVPWVESQLFAGAARGNLEGAGEAARSGLASTLTQRKLASGLDADAIADAIVDQVDAKVRQRLAGTALQAGPGNALAEALAENANLLQAAIAQAQYAVQVGNQRAAMMLQQQAARLQSERFSLLSGGRNGF